jgi:hypothetical protein
MALVAASCAQPYDLPTERCLEERQVEHAPPKGDTPPLRTVGSARPDLTDSRGGETRESPES